MRTFTPPRFASWLAVAVAVAGGGGAMLTAASSSLANSPSALVRAHADSPVRWMPWGAEAFVKARAESKPLYVVVGAFTSELGRAMRQQSFANADVAAQLNENFVCVLVDRDEHPGVAAALAQFVATTKQAKGWPLNVWLTPEGKPFEAGTYLPPTEEWGREGILNVIKRATTSWNGDPADVRARAEQALTDFVATTDLPAATTPAAPAAGEPTLRDKSNAAFATVRSAADPQHGGSGEPPRALEPELWAAQFARGGADRALALATLRALVASPMHDPLDGGFFRASGDLAWQRPSWVKTTADQARLALVLMAAAADEPAWRETARATLQFAVRELRQPNGGFITSVDALDDAASITMTWTESDVRAAVEEKDAAAFAALVGASAAGNIAETDDATGKLKGRNILGSNGGDVVKWKDALEKLRATRATRVAWQRDTNQRASINGLMLGALARAAGELKDAELNAVATELAEFLRRDLHVSSDAPLRLAGSTAPASADDLAWLAWGLGEWDRATKNAEAKSVAKELWAKLTKSYLDATRGVFLADPAPLAEGWKPASCLSGLVGEPPPVDWVVATSGENAPPEVRRVALQHVLAALEDPAGAPAAELLAAAELFGR